MISVAEVVLHRVRPRWKDAREINVESGEVLLIQPENAVLLGEILRGNIVDVLVFMFVLHLNTDATSFWEPRLWKLDENISTPITKLLLEADRSVRKLGHELGISDRLHPRMRRRFTATVCLLFSIMVEVSSYERAFTAMRVSNFQSIAAIRALERIFLLHLIRNNLAITVESQEWHIICLKLTLLL